MKNFDLKLYISTILDILEETKDDSLLWKEKISIYKDILRKIE